MKLPTRKTHTSEKHTKNDARMNESHQVAASTIDDNSVEVEAQQMPKSILKRSNSMQGKSKIPSAGRPAVSRSNSLTRGEMAMHEERLCQRCMSQTDTDPSVRGSTSSIRGISDNLESFSPYTRMIPRSRSRSLSTSTDGAFDSDAASAVSSLRTDSTPGDVLMDDASSRFVIGVI